MTTPDPRDMAAFIQHLRSTMEEGESNEQHSVLVRDPQTGTCHIVGPYKDRLTARIGAVLLQARNRQDDPELADLSYEIVLTFAPEQL